jgi:hypothetical protein
MNPLINTELRNANPNDSGERKQRSSEKPQRRVEVVSRIFSAGPSSTAKRPGRVTEPSGVDIVSFDRAQQQRQQQQ